MYTREEIENWLQHRNDTKWKTCFVSNKHDFGMIHTITYGYDDIVYISIESSKACAKYLNYTNDNSHYTFDEDNILNIEFDDVEEDIIKDNKTVAYAITQEQANAICEFIDKNIGKHIIIHCRAGQSRSQAIYSYIMAMYDDIYKPQPINDINPCISPNNAVKAKLMRYQYNKMFN